MTHTCIFSRKNPGWKRVQGNYELGRRAEVKEDVKDPARGKGVGERATKVIASTAHICRVNLRGMKA